MNWSVRKLLALGLSAGALLAAGVLALGGVPLAGNGRGGAAGASPHSGVSHQLSEARLRQLAKQLRGATSPNDLVLLSAELAPRSAGRTVTRFRADAPGNPTCARPTIPLATYPPGQSYGVPFLAAVTGGEILAGYDEWTADHTVWTVKNKTYQLDPWQSKVYDITGWVTGLLQLPSLSATIPPQDVVFCDQGGLSCVSADPPAGQCIHVSLGAAPVPGEAPPPPITDDPPPGHPCQGSPNCLPLIVSLTPVGDSTLTVTGVEPDGALELSVTTSAQTTVSLTEGTATQTCVNAPTAVTLSTEVPTSLPAGAPVPPTAGNPDLRSLQLAPLPLTGPLASASSTGSSNDFSVPAFAYPPSKACPAEGISGLLNTPLGGWNVKGNTIYYGHPHSATAGRPGWVQFTVTTTVFALELPVGPPLNFRWPTS
jgi:hypothetical protein